MRMPRRTISSISACASLVWRGCTLPQGINRLGFSFTYLATNFFTPDVIGFTSGVNQFGDQPLRVFLHVLGHKLIHAGGKSDDIGRNVIDEHGAVDADG